VPAVIALHWWRIAPLLLLACLLQVTLVPAMKVGGVWPSLPLVLLVFVALNASLYESLAVGFVTGAMLDLFASPPFGLLGLSYGALGLGAWFVRENVFIDSALGCASVAFVASLVSSTIVAAAEILAHLSFDWHCASWALLGSLYTAALALLLVLPLNRTRRFFGLLHRVQFGHVR